MTTGRSGGIGRRLILLIVVFAMLGLALGQLAWAEPAQITKAKQEAEALRAQIDELANDLDMAIEEYNYAVARLAETKAASETTHLLLTKAEADLEQANSQLVERLVEIYKEGQTGFLDTVLGSASFSEVVNRLDFMERMSGQDAEIVADVEAYTEEKTIRAAELAQQMEDQQTLAAQAEAARVKVEEKLAANEEALADKKDQIAQLIKEEEERQARLLEEARKAAEEAARRAQLAAIAAAERAKATTTTTKAPTPATQPGTTPTTKSTTTPTTKATVPVDVPDSADPSDVVSIALQYLGCPYVWAGSSPSGFDCSGFVMYVYKKVGINLPHSSRMQAGYGTPVSRDNLRPGDLVFFYNPIHHVAIYIGDGKMVHAAGVGKGVRIDEVWSRNYNCARRIIS